MEIKITGLGKKYGKKEILKSINLTIGKGMFGLLGKNGAGKTTLLRILATLSSQSEGEIIINNIPIKNSKKIREIIGYLPQNFSVYPDIKVLNVMEYFDLLSEMPQKSRKERIKKLLLQFNLWEERGYKVKSLSGGMKQKLGIALALLNNPQILVLDEPATGLDPEERIHLRNILSVLSDEKIVILSTHIIDDIAVTCNNIAVLHKGELLFNGKTSSLQDIASGKVFLLNDDKNITLPDGAMVVDRKDGKKRVLADVIPEGDYESALPNLEDGYMELIRGRE